MRRFIDSDLFADAWFHNLSKDAKLFWIYYICNCNNAGILKLHPELIKFQTKVNLKEVLPEFSNFIEYIKEDYLFCPKFIKFQYPDFPNSKVLQQRGAIKTLNQYGLYERALTALNAVNRISTSYDNDNDNEIKSKVKKRSEFVPPGLDEVKKYFKDNGYQEQTAEKAYLYYQTGGWFDMKGNKIKNWKQKMVGVWFKEENKVKSTNTQLNYGITN